MMMEEVDKEILYRSFGWTIVGAAKDVIGKLESAIVFAEDIRKENGSILQSLNNSIGEIEDAHLILKFLFEACEKIE